MNVLKIAVDFTKTPGARYPSEGLFSGEEFRKNILTPAYLKAKDEEYKLVVDLDDAVGYGTSWLEEAFGGLAREFGKSNVLAVLEFKSDQEPYLIDDIKDYVNEVE